MPVNTKFLDTNAQDFARTIGGELVALRQHLAVLIAVFLLSTPCAVGADIISFNRDIRPILSDRCYYCHGFDENHREAGLRLDIREEAEYVWDLDSPEESEIIYRVTSDDPDIAMPPPTAHKKALSGEEVALIRRWIEQGAVYEPHWAFVKPERPETQANSTSDAIDDFVARKHKEKGYDFGAPAIPTKWLRRVSLDLTGLPPTPAELDAFDEAVRAEGERAYQEAVDRLLASPAYGERVALDWLDVARYADTNGFQNDAYRMNWPWRDWVIRAFNDNMPYDQFTIEQLAGDLLVGPDGSGPSESQLIATAFNRNHMIQAEGGSIPEENIAKNNFDRVETTGTTWLGMTVGCCQCHDHKFDPLTQEDYYSLMSFFNQISETGMTSKKFSAKQAGRPFARRYWVDKPFIAVGAKELKRQLAEALSKAAALRTELDARRGEYLETAREWIQEMREDSSLVADRLTTYLSSFLTTADLENPNDADFKKLLEHYLKNNAPWKAYQAKIGVAEREAALLQEQIPLVMVMRSDKSRDTFVLLRGNYETPGDEVSPGTPNFLPPLPAEDASERPNRLDLARWLVSPNHPLTSRVTVNRYWQLMFGRGLVSTPDDFGLQGALPTHPELLDWLAIEFRESGWDVKALLKGIVLSRTYRQSAVAQAQAHLDDPDNEWLARGPRQRLDSRLLRDQALALSGLLNATIGGPPVAPYQPGGVWEAMSLNKNHYMRDDGADLYRRSLYTVWRRVVAPTNFFDVPSRQQCSVTITRTSTPLHALTTLNDTTYTEAARVWAEAVASDRLDPDSAGAPIDDQARLSELFYSATARQADVEELASLERTLDKARRRFEAHPDEAAQLIAEGEAPLRGVLKPQEHAAWTTVCLLVLNLDETLCK